MCCNYFIPCWKVTENTMSVLLFFSFIVAQKKNETVLLQMVWYCII